MNSWCWNDHILMPKGIVGLWLCKVDKEPRVLAVGLELERLKTIITNLLVALKMLPGWLAHQVCFFRVQ